MRMLLETVRRNVVVVLLSLSFLSALFFVVVVPPGLPYDEPAHWANVLHIVNHGSLPKLGDKDVSYEAQMGPVAYLLDALVAVPLMFFGQEPAFYGVRMLGVFEHLLLVALLFKLLSQITPSRPAVVLAGTTIVALNPMLLAMSSSVQNDTLSLAFALALLVVLTSATTSRRAPLAMGILAGLGVLTKITVWPVIVVVGVYLAVRRGWRSFLVFGGTIAVISGWWFLRNEWLYGDLTGRRGVASAGYKFPALGQVDPVALTRSAVTYLWLPDEYVRNMVHAPTLVEAAVVLLTAVGALGGLVAIIERGSLRRALSVLAATGVLAVTSWLVVTVTIQAVAFRVAYTAIPVWSLMFGIGAGKIDRVGRFVPLGIALILSLISGWFLLKVNSLTPQPFQIQF